MQSADLKLLNEKAMVAGRLGINEGGEKGDFEIGDNAKTPEKRRDINKDNPWQVSRPTWAKPVWHGRADSWSRGPRKAEVAGAMATPERIGFVCKLAGAPLCQARKSWPHYFNRRGDHIIRMLYLSRSDDGPKADPRWPALSRTQGECEPARCLACVAMTCDPVPNRHAPYEGCPDG
ncbi:hypothetical protein Pst134EB_004520 [Puccinia striiformis f. sp. tritici]|nr:hypothetical protein Pst134EB_004520 [Puccinia striiformis f. sp. tritici]